MKQWIVCGALFLMTTKAAVSCGTNGDTVVNVSGTLSSGALTALNQLVSTSGCTDPALTIELRSTTDTLLLPGPILVARTNSSSLITKFVGEAGVAPYHNLVILESNSVSAPSGGGQGYLFDATSPLQLTDFTVLRMVNSTTLTAPSIMLRGGKGSSISGCQFWLQDVNTASASPPAMIGIATDSVLIERSLFRAPTNGLGRAAAIYDAATGTHTEMRANVFNNTGVDIAGNDFFHLYANTFVGTRNAFSPVIIDANVPTGDSGSIQIQHNLFAVKNDTLSSIDFRSTAPTSLPNVKYNAYGSSASPPVFAVRGTVTYTPISVNGSTNVLMPKGYSNYGTLVPWKDFPLIQIGTDPTLSPSDLTFGELTTIYKGYPSSFPQVDSDLTNSKLFFPSNFVAYSNTGWVANNIKVGAFGAVDQSNPRPSPINPRANNPGGATSLHFASLAGNPVKISGTARIFDNNYYGAFFAPTSRLFFLSTSRDFLSANDSASLNHVAEFVSGNATCCTVPDTLSLPNDVRTAVAPGKTETLYLKLLHYNATGQAVIEDSNAVIDTITAVPAYPFNDLTLTYSDTSAIATGKATLTVTLGKESVDSIHVRELNASNAVTDSSTQAVSGLKTFTFINVPSGLYHFAAVPIGLNRVGDTAAAATTLPINFRQISGNTVYVKIPLGSCTGGSGSAGDPFCTLNAGLNYLQGLSGGGTVIVDSASQPMVNDTIAGVVNGNITVTSMLNDSGQFPLSRPMFASSTGTTSALTIASSNVTLKGFVLQMPSGASAAAVAVQATDTAIVLESNLFRAASRTGSAGTALSLGASSGHVSNNVFWGFSTAINIANSVSQNMWITENTFLNDSAFTGFATANAISVSAGSFSTRIYHNFFADYAAPYATSFKGGIDTLVGNVYTATPDQNLLQGHAEIRLMGVASPIPSEDLSAANPSYGASLRTSVFLPLESCDQLHECSPLYAGAYETSPPSGYPVLHSDFLGNPRVNRPEIGAYEFQNVAGNALGRLQLTVNFDTSFSQARVTLTSANIDSVDADSILVWWSTNKSDAYATVGANNRMSFTVTGLIKNGAAAGTAKGLVANTAYWFHSQLLRKVPASAGYIYSEAFSTSSLLTSAPCNLDSAHGVCPSQGTITGYFIDTTSGPFQREFQTQVLFNTVAPGSGMVQAPVYLIPDASRLKGLVPVANAPMIHLNVQTNGNMGQLGSNEAYQVNVAGMPDSLLSAMAGKDLYILPDSSTGLPTYVSDWSIDTSTGLLHIQLHSNGALDLVFGNFPAATAGGTVAPSSTNIQTYNYDGLKLQTFQWPLQGAAFLTSNPLILATPIPSGGVPGKSVISSTYPTASDLLSAGIVISLGDSLKYATALSYYRRMASADSGAAFFAHQQKPFYLNTVASSADLKAAVSLDSLSVDNSGSATPTAQLTFGSSWKAVVGQASRGIEVILTVFDGGKISYGHAFLQTAFSDSTLGPNDETVQFNQHVWNLYTYPWIEAPGGDIARLVGSSSFTYPKQKVLSYKGSGEGQAGYTVINAANFSSLAIDSGHAFWSGNGEQPYKPITAGGFSFDIRDFTLPLTAGQYNDFGTPFNFPIKLQDVLDTSGLTANSLAIYRLDYINSKAAWTRMDPTQSALGVLYPWMGYTVKPAAAVSLKFPLIDSSRSTTPLSKKTGTNALAWKADLWASDAEAIAVLRLSKGAISQQFGEAPSVPGQTFRIGFGSGSASSQSLWSEIEEPAAAGLKGHWPLQIVPQAGFMGMDLQLHDSTGNVSLFLVETLGKQITPLGDSTIHLSAEDVDQGDYNIVAGTAADAAAFLNSTLGAYDLRLVNFPNPFSGETSIRFSLPSTFLSVAYSLRIYDFQGRLVWEKTWNGGPVLNATWDGRSRLGGWVPAGQYHLLLQAQVPGKPAFEARRKLIKLD